MIPVQIAVMIGALGPMAAPAPGPPARSDLAANAALKYWQAFAQLPRGEPRPERLKDWNTMPLDGAAQRLIDAGEKSLLYLHRGAALPRCDWGLDYEDGPGLLLPHLDRARTLSQLAGLRARRAFADGRPNDGLDDALASFVLGRHVAADPILISILVDDAIEQNAIDMLAPHLPRLDAAALRRLTGRLDALPPAATIEQTLLTEKQYMAGWLIRWLKDRDRLKAADLRAQVRAVFGGSDDIAAVLTLLDDSSPRRLIRALEDLDPAYDQMRRLVVLPRDQFLARWPAIHDTQAANPVARVLLPALPKVVDARDRYQARLALLKAAIAVVRDGPDALAQHPDPFGRGPFERTALPHGFELRSKLTLAGRPITLTVGTR